MCQHSPVSNPDFIRFLVIFQGGFLDFSLNVGVSSKVEVVITDKILMRQRCMKIS